MKRSENITELSKALCKFQSEITNPTKDKVNPYHGSKYADLSEVINHIRKPLAENGLSFIQSVGSRINTELDLKTEIVVTTLLMHISGEWIESDAFPLPAQISKGGSVAQGSGASITYAKRYQLEAILGIASEEDVDGNTKEKGGNKGGHDELQKKRNNGSTSAQGGQKQKLDRDHYIKLAYVLGADLGYKDDKELDADVRAKYSKSSVRYLKNDKLEEFVNNLAKAKSEGKMKHNNAH